MNAAVSAIGSPTEAWNNISSVVEDLVLATNESLSEVYARTTAPSWMVEFVAFRKRLFMRTVEPIIVTLLGPVEEDWIPNSPATVEFINNFEHHNDETMHRRLSFMPTFNWTSFNLTDLIENDHSFEKRNNDMNFATFITLFVTMSCVFAVFLSCFYHNQNSSPLFISPRRHRLPKLVPPPLPIEGYFDWVSCCNR